jgi:amino acid adenylation domain-containing protein
MSELLHYLLQDAADRYPDALAVVDGDRELTYEQLEAAANRLAHQLAALRVRPGDRIGLCVEKSAESLICLYGVLKVGAAYVPLAAEWPAGRLAHIVRHAGIRVLLSGTERARHWPALTGPDSPVEYLMCVNGAADAPAGATLLGAADIARQQSDRPSVPVSPDDLAYVLYTSGSTGVPKGVMLTHRNALSFVDWAAAQFALTREDRLSNHAPLHFDLAVFDVFAAARVAAAVVLIPRSVAAFPAEMAAFAADKNISVWYSVPSALNMLATLGGLEQGGLEQRALPGLRLVLFAGEVFPTGQLRRAMAMFPNAVFYNLYGPTETNVCTFYRVTEPPPEDRASIPIGLPIDGVELSCLTDDGHEAAPGERGELWVRGPTVMRGYLDDPEHTAKVLGAPDPARPDLIAYCTGDLAARDATGIWHFAGRRDSQIKSRGYRIELGEIEAALNGHPSVVECAAIPVPDPMFGNLIMTYVVAAGDELGATDLTAYSRMTLPSYMVPSSFGFLAALPRTSTGKIDYQALKLLQEENDRGKRHRAP